VSAMHLRSYDHGSEKQESAITEKPVWFITGCSTGFGRKPGI